jgi:hypothetical protein
MLRAVVGGLFVKGRDRLMSCVWSRGLIPSNRGSKAFSSEADAGSREENA